RFMGSGVLMNLQAPGGADYLVMPGYIDFLATLSGGAVQPGGHLTLSGDLLDSMSLNSVSGGIVPIFDATPTSLTYLPGQSIFSFTAVENASSTYFPIVAGTLLNGLIIIDAPGFGMNDDLLGDGFSGLT